jgi:hypothetical protein
MCNIRMSTMSLSLIEMEPSLERVFGKVVIRKSTRIMVIGDGQTDETEGEKDRFPFPSPATFSEVTSAFPNVMTGTESNSCNQIQ